MARKRGQNEGSIYQELPGKWRASVSLGWRNGKRIRKTFTAPTRREVQEKLTNALRNHQQGYNVAPEKRTLGQWLQEWLQIHVKPSVRFKTHLFYECVIRNWITPKVGQVLLQKLTPTKIQEFLNANQAGGLAPRTVRHVHRTLVTALGVAEGFGYVPRNVARLVEPVHVPKPAMRFLTTEQARIFLAAAEDHRLYALFAVTLALGLRLGEALGLRWEDIDLDGARLTVRYALQRVKASGEKQRKPALVDPKSESSRRTVKLPLLAINALRRHRAAQEQECEFAGDRWKGNLWGLVFTSSIGTPLNERNILRTFQGILKRAGLPKMRIHDLRHSAAAILLASGLSAKAVAELLGHSAVSFTLQVYGHLMDEAKQQTADVMDAALEPVATSLATFKAPARVN